MGSKIISGGKAAAIQPIAWRPIGGAQDSGSSYTDQASPKKASESDDERARVLLNQQKRLQELESELESRPRQAYQQGYREGQMAGAQQAAKSIEPVAEKMAESIRDLATLRGRYLHDVEEDALKLAIAIARKVLHRELTVDSEALLGVVKAAFERVDARDVHRVRLNPADVPLVQRFLASAGVPPRVEIAPDPSLERGGIVIETTRGLLDASISSQLKEIEQGLTDLVRRNPS